MPGLPDFKHTPAGGTPRNSLLLPLLALALLGLAALACSLPSLGQTPVNAGENPTPTTAVTPGNGPTLQLAPAQGAPGDHVTVMGQRWQPGSTALLRLENPATGEGQQSIYASAAVTEGGTFTALIMIPADLPWPGLAAVQVRAWSATTGESATALFQFVTSAGGTPIATEQAPATPAATQTPGTATEASPTPSPIPSLGGSATVLTGGVNLRTGPAVAYDLITLLPAGTLLEVLGQTRRAIGSTSNR